jgi:ABC-type phosphate transport system ATPase subunit
MSAALLQLRDLRVSFRAGRAAGGVLTPAVGRVIDGRAVGVSFDIPENTTVALVGESGSGKSVTAMSILNLLPDNAVRSGSIVFDGRDLIAASTSELQALRGRQIAAGLQDVLQVGIRRGALHQRAEAELREPGRIIAGDRPHHRLVATHHENIGDGFGQMRSVSQGQQVLLTPLVGQGDEILLLEPRRTLDDRASDLDIVVEREVADGLARRVRNVGETLGEFDAGAELDFMGEADDDLVENPDMFLVEMGGLIDEQTGHGAQARNPAAFLAARDGVLDFRDK